MYPYRYDEIDMQKESQPLNESQLTMQEYKFSPPEHRPEYRPDNRPEHRPEHGPVPHGKPPKEPPLHIPKKRPYVYAVDPGAIRGCLYNFTYVWMDNGRAFWFYPVYVGRQSVAGYRWSRFGWTYSGMDLDSIQSFSCGA